MNLRCVLGLSVSRLTLQALPDKAFQDAQEDVQQWKL